MEHSELSLSLRGIKTEMKFKSSENEIESDSSLNYDMPLPYNVLYDYLMWRACRKI